MRLIEAETVKEMLMRVIFGADRKIDAWVDAMPAVDAIPVEWLKEKRNDELHKLAENVYGRLEDELCIAIIRVLELWNKEKEGDNG